MGGPENPYKPPTTAPVPTAPATRRSWMRFVPAVVCITYGAMSTIMFLVTVWARIAPAELVGRASLSPVLIALPLWAVGIVALMGVAFVASAVLWVRGRYRKALLLSLIAFGTLGLLRVILK